MPSSSEPEFPKSFYLISPLTSAYDLNPVAPEAQASVPIPEGLNLDMWIIPPPTEEVAADGTGKKKKKSKGKEKEKEKTEYGKVQKEKELMGVEETPEERAERERVCVLGVLGLSH